jgi:hypothetical protein
MDHEDDIQEGQIEKNTNKNRNVEFETYPQMPLRASMLKLAACDGNMLQAEPYDSGAKIFT